MMGGHAHMALDVGYASDVGGRENQEDNLGFRQYEDGSLLAVLADGMGGHAGGEVASEMAVRLFGEYFPQTLGTIPTRLDETLHYTHRQLCRQVQARPELKSMGATLIAVFIQGSELYWASVGDSLLYVANKAGVMKINAEHTVRERFKRLLEGGKISQAEFEAVEEPHALTSALGPDKLHEIDGNQRVFHKGEVLILASDGLLGLEQPEIHALIDRQVSAQVLADRLLRATLEKRRAGQDNIGIIVIKQPQRQMFTRSSLLVVLGGVLLLGACSALVYQVYQSGQMAEQERLKREQAEQQVQREKIARQQADESAKQATQKMQAATENAKQERSKRVDAEKREKAQKNKANKAWKALADATAKARREATDNQAPVNPPPHDAAQHGKSPPQVAPPPQTLTPPPTHPPAGTEIGG